MFRLNHAFDLGVTLIVVRKGIMDFLQAPNLLLEALLASKLLNYLSLIGAFESHIN